MYDLKDLIKMEAPPNTTIAKYVVKLGGIVACIECDYQTPVTEEIIKAKLGGKWCCPDCGSSTKWYTQTELQENPRGTQK